MIEIVLVGGPSGEPELWQIDETQISAPVKVPRLSGYEHFDPTGYNVELDGNYFPVFLWSFRTRTAE